ncbi:FAD-binding oxidoreductase [Burkholderia sp. GS2Y]|uniref:FAD-binding protein n=1 Tax=Burkholderia theae TaxID=3143496 RepID=A0ABU9WS79_9BURK
MMISCLPADDSIEDIYGRFFYDFRTSGFEGDIDCSQAVRAVLSTNNSIYQIYPEAALFPRHSQDVQCIAKLLGQAQFRDVVVAPRGGGAGTNGQSLTNGVVVDLSRHMNRVSVSAKSLLTSGKRSGGSFRSRETLDDC